MPALTSSPIPDVLAKLEPFDPRTVSDLRPYLDKVPDPRSAHGRWYSLAAILSICACAAVSGAKSVDELAEWGQRTPVDLLETIGIRPHPLHWRRAPSAPTIDRVLTRLDAQALDAAIGAYLTDRRRTAPDPTTNAPNPPPEPDAIAVDGKALKGSARLDQPRRHLLSALAHNRPITLAQEEVGSKSNETRHFRPLLADLDLVGRVITCDALHTVKDHLAWLVKDKKAHYVAVVKTNQPTLHAQVRDLGVEGPAHRPQRLQQGARPGRVSLSQGHGGC